MKRGRKTVRERMDRLEDRLNDSIKNSRITWGLVILIAAGAFAIYRIMKSVFYFF